jgi:hypothetical protein
MIDSMLSRMSLRLRLALQKIQSVLAFEAWTKYPAYNNNQGLGRAALISLILGVILGMHTILLIVAIMIQMQNQSQFIVVNNSSTLSLGPYRIQLLIQWCMYIICVCNFHLAEFFATSIWNPRVVSSDSFIVNHSYAYTAAAIVSTVTVTVTVTREYCGTLVVWTFFCRLVLTLSRCCTYVVLPVISCGVFNSDHFLPASQQCIRDVRWLDNCHCGPNHQDRRYFNLRRKLQPSHSNSQER